MSLTLVRQSAPLREGGALAPGRRRGLDCVIRNRNWSSNDGLHPEWSMETPEALINEGRGGRTLDTKEIQAGAARFAAGKGRGGDFGSNSGEKPPPVKFSLKVSAAFQSLFDAATIALRRR